MTRAKPAPGRRSLPALAVLLLTLAVWTAQANAAGEPLAVPLIDTPALGEAIAAGRGKVVLVTFFASWCLPCRKEMPELIAARRDIPEKDFLLLGVSVDTDAQSLGRYLAQTPINFPVLRAGLETMSAFRLDALPGMALFDPAGRLRMHQAGTITATNLGRLVRRHLGGDHE
jgi:thiol-disulfide isomerase/thioredoxin